MAAEYLTLVNLVSVIKEIRLKNPFAADLKIVCPPELYDFDESDYDIIKSCTHEEGNISNIYSIVYTDSYISGKPHVVLHMNSLVISVSAKMRKPISFKCMSRFDDNGKRKIVEPAILVSIINAIIAEIEDRTKTETDTNQLINNLKCTESELKELDEKTETEFVKVAVRKNDNIKR